VGIDNTRHVVHLGPPYLPAYRSRQEFENDPWMRDFIEKADCAVGGWVTAAQALEILRELKHKETADANTI
jgi:hypothetical protein